MRLLCLLAVFCLVGCGKQHVAQIVDDAGFFNTPPQPATSSPKPGQPKPPSGQSGKNVTATPAKSPNKRAEVKERLDRISAAKNLDIVLKTVDRTSAPRMALGFYIDEQYSKDPAWLAVSTTGLRPIWRRLRTTLGVEPGPPPDAVYIFLVGEPKFLAIRFGEMARLRALSSGLLSSRKLRALQERSLSDPVAALEEMLSMLSEEFPGPEQEGWLRKLTRFFFYPELVQTLNSMTMPRWRLYNRLLLKPVLQLQFEMLKYVAPTYAPIVAIAISLFLIQFIAQIVGEGVGKLFGLPFVGEILSFCLGIIGLLPSVGSVLLLARQRLEDQYFVSALFGDTFPIVASLFDQTPVELVGQTGFLWAIPVALLEYGVFVLNAHAMDALDNEPEQLFLRPFRNLLLFGYLPFAATLTVGIRIITGFLAAIGALSCKRVLILLFRRVRHEA